jgi:hypothetical protein
MTTLLRLFFDKKWRVEAIVIAGRPDPGVARP